MHTHTHLHIAGPTQALRHEIDSFLAQCGPRDAKVIEIKVWRKDKKPRRRLLKTIQILICKGKSTRQGVEAYYHESPRGDLWKTIRFWKNVMIPELNLWCSILSLVSREVEGLARIKKIILADFEVSYEIDDEVLDPKTMGRTKRDRTIHDIVEIEKAKSGEAAARGGYLITREGAVKNKFAESTSQRSTA